VSTAEIEARQQLELDLHDGPQERLALAALTLRRAAGQARGTSAERLVAQALEELREGLAELRDLGRRIHPYALSRYGLPTALEGLAARSPLPIELGVTGGRLQPAIEAAVYFTIAEALEHLAEDPAATRATVTVSRAREAVVAEIAADRAGGARLADSYRLRRVAAGVEALSGRLELNSPQGAGARVRAVFPMERHDLPEQESHAPCGNRRRAAVDHAARGSS
jgi:signal transduction histidine kinase